jgi:hypothetical protein
MFLMATISDRYSYHDQYQQLRYNVLPEMSTTSTTTVQSTTAQTTTVRSTTAQSTTVRSTVETTPLTTSSLTTSTTSSTDRTTSSNANGKSYHTEAVVGILFTCILTGALVMGGVYHVRYRRKHNYKSLGPDRSQLTASYHTMTEPGL